MKGKIILITGGATGIGLALITKLYNTNTIISFDRRESNVKFLNERFGAKVRSLKVDINDHDRCFNAIDLICEEFKRIDIFISNAGYGVMVDILSVDQNTLRSNLREEVMTNYISPVLMCKHLIPVLRRSREPIIVITTSGLAYTPIAQFAGYCAAKSAAHSFAVSLRYQLMTSGIRVVETLPPTVDTNFNKGIDAPKISTDRYADAFLEAFSNGKSTIRIGQSGLLEKFSRLFPQLAFKMLNKKK